MELGASGSEAKLLPGAIGVGTLYIGAMNSPSQFLTTRKWAAAWQDPLRRYRTLQSFSETEEDGGRDLVAACRRVSDPELRMHMTRHADDEVRHADLFRTRANEVRDLAMGGGATDGKDTGSGYDLSGARNGLDLDSHGFFNAGIYDEIGEVAYVAMLHVAEQRAAEVFQIHHDLNDHDPETQALFKKILKDEHYHVSYTGRFLEKWREEGRGREVDEALSAAKSSRFIGAWKRLGVRSGANFSRVVMLLMYWTVIAPFGLLSRRSKTTAEWQAPKTQAPTGSRQA